MLTGWGPTPSIRYCSSCTGNKVGTVGRPRPVHPTPTATCSIRPPDRKPPALLEGPGCWKTTRRRSNVTPSASCSCIGAGRMGPPGIVAAQLPDGRRRAGPIPWANPGTLRYWTPVTTGLRTAPPDPRSSSYAVGRIKIYSEYDTEPAASPGFAGLFLCGGTAARHRRCPARGPLGRVSGPGGRRLCPCLLLSGKPRRYIELSHDLVCEVLSTLPLPLKR